MREQRLAKLAEARAKIEARAKERYECERAEHEAKLAAREAKTAATGNKPGGKPPAPAVLGRRPRTDQSTDEPGDFPFAAASSSLQRATLRPRGAFSSLRRCPVHVPNDKQQLEPMPGEIERLCPNAWARSETRLAVTGFFSAAKVDACREARIAPLIAKGRRPHRPPREPVAEQSPARIRRLEACPSLSARRPQAQRYGRQRPERCSASSDRRSAAGDRRCAASPKSAAVHPRSQRRES